jgi:ABC-2 type transport system permease protein
MTLLRLVKSELRKLTSTRMPWAFLAVLVAISSLTAVAVILGTDMDGSKAFISTADDQRSLIAFAANAVMGSALFGAIAAAREYSHGTVVPTFLAAPRRHQPVLAQLSAVAIVGGVLSLIGAGLTALAVAMALPATDYTFMVSAAGVAQVMAASLFAGVVGGVMGAGVGTVVRNTGGAVTVAFLLLMIVPPLAVQMVSEASSWVPATLATVLSGVTSEVGILAALAAMAAWAAVPAAIGLVSVNRRDVV